MTSKNQVNQQVDQEYVEYLDEVTVDQELENSAKAQATYEEVVSEIEKSYEDKIDTYNVVLALVQRYRVEGTLPPGEEIQEDIKRIAAKQIKYERLLQSLSPYHVSVQGKETKPSNRISIKQIIARSARSSNSNRIGPKESTNQTPKLEPSKC